MTVLTVILPFLIYSFTLLLVSEVISDRYLSSLIVFDIGCSINLNIAYLLIYHL